MRVEQNTISRDWAVFYKGRRFFVNFTESDGQTLVLCNRNNWEITEQTKDGVEDVSACVFKGSSAAEQRQAEENAELIEQLVAFCIENWDNEFMHEVQDELWGQKALLETWR
jgi:hypothetical protein